MDYVTEILGATLVAHDTSAHRSFGGIVFPTHRPVFWRNPDGIANLNMPMRPSDVPRLLDTEMVKVLKTPPRPAV